MRALFELFLDICLFRKGPQDLPAGMALLKLCLLGYGLSGFVVLQLSTPAPVAILQILLDLAVGADGVEHRDHGPHPAPCPRRSGLGRRAGRARLHLPVLDPDRLGRWVGSAHAGPDSTRPANRYRWKRPDTEKISCTI
ncbi:MAG: hypothetical protein H6R48_1152 [Proteobacteria bacterium]|nr:hypothetical protein [Pseudomonadota bacterium]